MRTIAVANPKGGSGKTTTVVNLAAELATLGKRVLVIDMDPQASASAWLGVPETDFDVMRAIKGEMDLPELVHETTAPGVQLVPGSPRLIATAGPDENEVGNGFMRAMARLPEAWDLVLVDCAPSLGYLGIAPIAACQGMVIPVEAHILAMAGLASLLSLAERVREILNPRLTVDGILACRVTRTAHGRLVVERIEAAYPKWLMRTQVRDSIGLAEAPGFRLPISRYAPGSTADEDYRAAAAELLERLTAASRRRRSKAARQRTGT